MITVKNIFEKVQGINPKTNSYGYVDSSSEQHANFLFGQFYALVPEGSLAKKIMVDQKGTFSDKQLWVIAYELMKNEAYVNELQAESDKVATKAAARAIEAEEKAAAQKEANTNVLAEVKSAGRKLGDYYAWVKGNKKYAREYYSKKYTAESVKMFLAA